LPKGPRPACTFTLCLAIVLLPLFIFPRVHGDPGNAEVSRTRNLQCFEMTPSMHPRGNASVTRLRNLQCFEMTPQVHPPGDAYVTRFKNLQSFEMTPQVHPLGDAYVTRLKNLQSFEMTPQIHPPGNAHISRLRNLQCFEMTPQVHPLGDAHVTRFRNLQCFEMAYQIHEIKVNIAYLATADQNGNQTVNFMKGDMVQINFTIHNTGVPFTNALISTVILDPSSNVVFLSYTFEDFSVGTKENLVFGYRIPQEAPAGTYTVKVMVFTDWPSEGGVGLDVKIATFDVS